MRFLAVPSSAHDLRPLRWFEGYMNLVSRSTILAVLITTMPSAFAVRMDEATHDQVIKRLEMGIDAMDKSEPERNGVLRRLADLYADRARLKAINEMDAGNGTGKASKEDRARAIALYNEALPGAGKENQGRIVIQLAHLYTLNDQSSKATQLYTQVLNGSKSLYSSDVKAIANSSMGDIYFRKGDFNTALKYFERARKENLKNRAIVEYRMAWCQLNLGQTQKATQTLINLLKNPELLATQSEDGQSVDVTFVQDISNDLAKFIARSDVRANDIQLLKDLSPDNVRKTNLYTLGTETDRLGKKAASLLAWAAYVDEGDVKPDEKLEVQTRVAQILYDLNKLDLAADAYEKATGLWTQHNCKQTDLCEELKSRLRKIATAWNKAQKKKPTAGLFRVYSAYTNTFPDDTEMAHWAAVVGSDLKRYREAAALFHRAATLALVKLQKDPKNKSMQNIFEGSLLGEIEMAEASKDLKAREQAYNYYLSVNSAGARAFEVRYQRAQLFSQTNRHQEAFSEYHYLASMPGKENREMKIKSADLALDSLVALKDDRSLQVRPLEYARIFPERRAEYTKISRKATLTIVAANLKNEKSNSRSDYKTNLAALEQVNMDGADDSEKITFFKNKILIAQKALEFTAVTKAANQLLAVKSLKANDEEWAMAQKVWAAELQLDFAQAYKISKQMQMPHLSKADRELRLALLADLAGLNSRGHHENYLRLAKDNRAANLVRITLIKNSARPWSELNKQMRFLKQTPDLLAGVSLEVFARDRDLNKAQQLLRTTTIARYAAGQTIARQFDLRDFQAFDRKIRAHKMFGFSDAALQKTLKERLNLLTQSEKLAQSAFKRKDWTLEVLSVGLLARENRRLYNDILNLPIPRRLNKEQREQYVQMIQAQSKPYLDKAEKLEAQLEEVWGQSASMQNLQAAYMNASSDMQRLYRDEISALSQNAPSRAQNRLRELLNTPYRRPSQKDILLARRALQADPLDISKAETLRQLESQGGSQAMASYLDERIAELKKGKTL